jgi:hypothetical protein
MFALFFLLLASLASFGAKAPETATIVVGVQDEAGNPVSIVWFEKPAYGRSVTRSCDAQSPVSGGYYCASKDLVTKTTIDGKHAREIKETTGQEVMTFELAASSAETHELSYFLLEAPTGVHKVQFPVGIRGSDPSRDVTPIEGTMTWDFQVGKVFILTVRTASHVRLGSQEAKSRMSFWYLDLLGQNVYVRDGDILQPGSYVFRWTGGADQKRMTCKVVADASFPKAVPADIVLRAIPNDQVTCVPNEHIEVSLVGNQAVYKKVVDPVPETGSGVFVDGVEVRLGDSVTVQPGKDLVIDVRTPTATPATTTTTAADAD